MSGKSKILRLNGFTKASPLLVPQRTTQHFGLEAKRETFRRDTLQAWERYRSTGQHVTSDEADAWLQQLEQGNDVEPPKCHF